MYDELEDAYFKLDMEGLGRLYVIASSSRYHKSPIEWRLRFLVALEFGQINVELLYLKMVKN